MYWNFYIVWIYSFDHDACYICVVFSKEVNDLSGKNLTIKNFYLYMETLLLDKHQIELIPTTNINLENTRNNHRTLLDNNHDVSVKMQQLIHAMGGIDIVLSNYLSDKNPFPPTTNQLKQINDIFDSVNSQTKILKQTTDKKDSVLCVSVKDTLLNDITTESTATKIMNIIFGKGGYCLGFIIIFEIILLSISTIYSKLHALRYIGTMLTIYDFCKAVLVIIYFIFALLSLNKTVVRKILKTFEFWFKLFYFMRYFICTDIYQLRTNITIQDAIYINMILVCWFLFIIFYSCID
eukprot:503444_1